jgi:hypothetical protein
MNQLELLVAVFAPFMTGLIIGPIMHLLGMAIGEAGIEYYAEVHTSFSNSMVHTIFMPFTIYGAFLWIPYVFRLNKYDANVFQFSMFLVYAVHYLTFSTVGFLLFYFLFLAPTLYSINHYRNDITSFCRGLIIMVGALVIQEVFGHWLSGDEFSRTEAIPNAVIYAPLYAAYHFIL